MGRILRQKRVGNEDTGNLLKAKLDVLVLKDPKANNCPVNSTTDSSCKTRKRTVLMDKTNVLKQKDNVKQKIGASASKLKDPKNSTRKPKGNEQNLGKVTRRRDSFKENDREPRKSPQDEIESRPLGDNTNAPAPKKKLLKGAISSEISEDKDVETNDSKPANKKSVSSDNIPNSLSSERPVRNCPPRNAAKFENGWISALRSSRTSKESDREPQKSSSPITEPKPGIPFRIDDISPPGQEKRACRSAKDAKTGKGVSDDIKPGENLASSPNDAAKQGVSQVSRSKQRKSSTSESDCSSKASHDEEATNQQVAPNESPLRKLPPRNAAKFEKGRISSLRRSRNSKEYDCDLQKSPLKPEPLDERTKTAKEVGKTGSGEDVEKGKERKSLHSSKSKETAKEMPTKSGDSDEEKDSVTELRKVPERLLGRKKNRLVSSAQNGKVKEMDLESTPKPGATSTSAAESKPRGLGNFESRIAAKLGIDMSGSVSGTRTKDSDMSPKKPSAKETSSRRLRKRVVDRQIKTYAEAEESEDEIVGKFPSNQGSKIAAKTSVKPLTVSRRAKMIELKDIKASATLTRADSEEATSVVNNRKEKESGSLNCSNSTLYEPKPGCSRDSEYITPLRKTAASMKSPLVAPSSSLFSIFKKPENPRRNSFENKIFVSRANPCPPAEGTNKKQLPIYGNPNMTPLKITSALPQEKKEELYDFEVDENEPKPKKRHKPIMKIQRLRAVKRKKPKVYEADPETERRVLRNLDLSPSVFEEFRSAKKKKVENSAGVIAAQPSQSPHPAETAEIDGHPPDPDVPDYHDLHFDGYPMSSPCRDYGQSTPIRTDAPSMFMDDSRDKFGRLSAKIYSPVKSKDSPIPVLMAEYNNDPVCGNDSSRRSVASNVSCVSGVSGNSIYQNDLDVSASTPVKFNRNDSTTYERQRRKPVELNISNCFGFDEPEIMEEPLVSPIKSAIHVPVHTAPVKHLPTLKSKPPVMLPPPETSPAIDVDQVIKQLRFEVGENSSANNSLNISVYDDSEITMNNKSTIKRYLQPKHDHKHKANKAADESTADEGNDDIPVAPKVPRMSYERPNYLRKKKVLEPVHKDVEREPAEHIFEPTKNTPKKQVSKKKEKGMTKKEEEELEKWAQMFNSQCNQISGYGLVVE